MPDPFKIVINAVSAQPIVLAPQVSSGQKLTILQGPITITGTQLVPATNSILGGIIVGSNLSITNNGVLSANIPPQGVTAFNGRTGNVSLTADDVTAVANGIYQANGSYLNDLNTTVLTSTGTETLRGVRKSIQSSFGNFVAGSLSFGKGLVGVSYGNEVSAVEFGLGDFLNTLRLRQYKHTLLIADNGISVETGTADWSWTANHTLTQGRGDARYQPVGSYLTSANLTWSNLTGKPTFATVATSGSYTDLANTPNLSLYYLASNPTGYITAACLTYSNVTGTPDLTVYLTTANAATTYLPSANFSFSNLTGKPTTLSGYGITDGLTSATAAATYLPSSNFTYANITGKPTLSNVATSGNYSDLSGTPNLSLYPTLAANNSFTGCNTFTGQINCNSTLALSGNLVTAPKIQAYSETANAPSISGGNLTLNLSLANVFGPVTLNANISNLTISNPPASGTAGSFTLLLKANGTAFTVTWPAAVLWAGGTAPTLTSTANKTDVFSFVTTDGGTSYYGFKAGQNF